MALSPPGPGGGEEVEHGYKGKGSLLHLVTDKEGIPLWITTTSAKGNERIQALVLLDQLELIQSKDAKRMPICEADIRVWLNRAANGDVAKELCADYRLSKKSEESLADRRNMRLLWSIETKMGSREKFCLAKKKMQKAPWGMEAFTSLGFVFMWLQKIY